MSVDNVLRYCPKIEYLAQRGSFEGKCNLSVLSETARATDFLITLSMDFVKRVFYSSMQNNKNEKVKLLS